MSEVTDVSECLPEDAAIHRKQMNALYAALAAAQGEFLPIPKNRTAVITAREGRASYSYKYADLEVIISAVRPALSKHGLALVQIVEHDLLITAVLHKDGGRLESHITAPSVQKNAGDLKQYAIALAYIRRYMITALLGLAADDDLDANGSDDDGGAGGRMGDDNWSMPPTTQRRSAPPRPSPASQPAAPREEQHQAAPRTEAPAPAGAAPLITPEQLKLLTGKLAAMKVAESIVMAKYEVGALAELTGAQYRAEMEVLRS